MMRDDALAQGDEFGMAHVILGIIGATRAEGKAQCSCGFEKLP
jgi:hypothetical protein